VGFEPTVDQTAHNGFRDRDAAREHPASPHVCEPWQRLWQRLFVGEVGVEQSVRLVLGAGEQVAVAVERDCDVRVTEVGTHGLGVEPGGDEQRGCGVPRLVEPERRQLDVAPAPRPSPPPASTGRAGRRWSTARREEVRAATPSGSPRPEHPRRARSRRPTSGARRAPSSWPRCSSPARWTSAPWPT
jgi:hypothetical protein